MKTPVSPKVTWGAITGLVAAVALAVLTALLNDPTGLGFTLPTWAVFLLASAAPVLIQALAAYLTRDPLRDWGQAALVRPEPTPLED